MDPDIQRMQVAGHNMIRHLTAGMAMITCREPLLLHISNNLKSAFTMAIRVIVLNRATYFCGYNAPLGSLPVMM